MPISVEIGPMRRSGRSSSARRHLRRFSGRVGRIIRQASFPPANQRANIGSSALQTSSTSMPLGGWTYVNAP